MLDLLMTTLNVFADTTTSSVISLSVFLLSANAKTVLKFVFCQFNILFMSFFDLLLSIFSWNIKYMQFESQLKSLQNQNHSFCCQLMDISFLTDLKRSNSESWVRCFESLFTTE
jgi:hypothetical protein